MQVSPMVRKCTSHASWQDRSSASHQILLGLHSDPPSSIRPWSVLHDNRQCPAGLIKDQAESSFINCEWIYSPNAAERHFSSLNGTVLCLLKIFRAGFFPSRHRGTTPLELMELDWLTPVEKPAQDLTGLILSRFHSDSNFSTLHPPSGTHLISYTANLYST